MADIVKDIPFCVNKVEKVILELIDPDNNHNKYYILSRSTENPGHVLAQWGRIGSKHQSKLYRAEELTEGKILKSSKDGEALWMQMVKKIKKGYQIKTYKCFGEHSDAYLEFMNLLEEDGGCELFDDDGAMF
jgi:predicted DNA-binding WGR domain protein